MAAQTGPVRDAGRREEGDSRGDEEGLPQARAPVPPRPQPRRQAGGGALQGDLARLRRAVGSREAQAVRQRHRAVTRTPGAAGSGASATSTSTPPRWATSSPTSLGGRRAAGARARSPARSAGATWRRRCRSPSSRRCRARRFRSRSPPRRLRDLPRHGRQAGHDAEGVPEVRGARDRDAGPGDVLDLAAVLALRRLGHGDRGSLPDLPRLGRGAHGEEIPREHPRGREGGLAHPPARQGRGRPARRSAGRPVRDHARGALAGLQTARRQRRGRGAAHDPGGAARRRGEGADAERHEDAARAARARPTARSSACAARARRSSAAAEGWMGLSKATSTTAS